jgi:hypothetical protein
VLRSSSAVPDNIYRFRRLKWGKPQKPWLERGAPLPPEKPRGVRLDNPLVIFAGAALAFGLGWLLFS